MTRAAVAPFVLAAWVAMTGCHAGKASVATEESEKPVVASDVLRLIRLSHDEVLRRVGAHRFSSTDRIVITVGDSTDVLEEKHTLEVSRDGAYRAVTENSKDQGREIVFVAGDIFVRPRYGTFIRRRPESGEASRLRAETFGTLPAALEYLGRFVDVKDEGTATWEGRDVRQFALGLLHQPRPHKVEDQPARAWRSTVEVQELSGTVRIDVKTRCVLQAALKAQYTFRRGDETARATFQYDGTLLPATEVAIAVPDHVPRPVRRRYHAEQQELLKGLRGP